MYAGLKVLAGAKRIFLVEKAISISKFMFRKEEISLGWKILNGTLTIPEDFGIADTFVDFGCNYCEEWSHGAVFVNNFNIDSFLKVAASSKPYFLLL